MCQVPASVLAVPPHLNFTEKATRLPFSLVSQSALRLPKICEERYHVPPALRP